MLNGLSGDFFVLKCLCECFFFSLFKRVLYGLVCIRFFLMGCVSLRIRGV